MTPGRVVERRRRGGRRRIGRYGVCINPVAVVSVVALVAVSACGQS